MASCITFLQKEAAEMSERLRFANRLDMLASHLRDEGSEPLIELKVSWLKELVELGRAVLAERSQDGT